MAKTQIVSDERIMELYHMYIADKAMVFDSNFEPLNLPELREIIEDSIMRRLAKKPTAQLRISDVTRNFRGIEKEIDFSFQVRIMAPDLLKQEDAETLIHQVVGRWEAAFKEKIAELQEEAEVIAQT